MQVQLGGKVAIVTGASRGIGCAVVTMQAAEGAHVVAVARSEAMLAELVAALPVPGLAVVADLRQEGAAQRVVEAALQAFARRGLARRLRAEILRRDSRNLAGHLQATLIGPPRVPERLRWPPPDRHPFSAALVRCQCQCARPSMTVCVMPPTHTVPSASMRIPMCASCPISRPWLTR